MRFPKHAFPVRTTFRRCLLVNFAVDPAELNSVLPRHVHADLYQGEGFVSVVVGEMEKMRPAGIPHALGITYRQIVYRAVVRCGDERGVNFLRSDADSRVMTSLGNLLSFFRFHRSDIRFRERGHELDLDVVTRTRASADIEATFQIGAASTAVPASSAFSDLDEAKAWLVELFAAFDHTDGSDSIDVVRIERGDWNVRVVTDTRARYAFMSAGAPFTRARLDSVFSVGDVPYYWHRLQRKPLPEPGS
jgi:uncharacterized protein YqjF (DUF2071 family)